ncbi:DUF6221 family protein [Catellatospora sp. NPDC049609]|uniref:DUF6221 family protein n=1 Tax=Catellatospora sp. NPDC049609 TaxID=3155505 RepID=UPI00341EA017
MDNGELIRFLRAKLDADEHHVVYVQAVNPPGQPVLLESTVDALDMIRTVVDLYAEVEHLDTPEGAGSGDAYAAGRAAGLGQAVRRLAAIYHEDPAFRAEWRPW